MSIITLKEGDTVYWRVSAQNLAGPGPWSETGRLFLLAPPDDLELEVTSSTQITLKWDDNSDIEEGYVIERRATSANAFSVIDSVASDIEEYLDSGLGQQGYTYRVKAYLGEESSAYSESVSSIVTSMESVSGIPTDYSLSQNYPNPFNPATNIRIGLPKAGRTRIAVYDILGKEIGVPLDQILGAGYHEFSFDASDLPGGLYLYRIESGDFVRTKKMILMK